LKLPVRCLDLDIGGRRGALGKALQARADGWCRGLIAGEDKMVIFFPRSPRAARAEESNCRPNPGCARPGGSQAGIAVGDKVHVEVPGRWVQVNQGVGAGHWLFIPGLLLANLFEIEWPRIIGPLWREE